MMKKYVSVIMIVAALFTLSPSACAFDLGDVVKTVAVGYAGGFVVSKLAPQLNDFINTLTLQNGVNYKGYTKVVPIVSLGDGAKVGAAQVGATTQSALDATKAVAMLEGKFQSVEAKALIPINSTNPLKGVKRVAGVGVTAIIDVQL